MNFSTRVLVAALIFLPLVSCTKEKREVIVSADSSALTGPATMSTMQEDIFRLGCAVSGCHDNRATPASNLSMVNASRTYDELVGQPSTQALDLKLVEPGDAEKSYLINKLRGTHLTVGGTGVRMPQYAAPLAAGDLERIVEWINNGAQRN